MTTEQTRVRVGRGSVVLGVDDDDDDDDDDAIVRTVFNQKKGEGLG